MNVLARHSTHHWSSRPGSALIEGWTSATQYLSWYELARPASVDGRRYRHWHTGISLSIYALTVVVHAERNARQPAQPVVAQWNTAADLVACTKLINYFLNKIWSKMAWFICICACRSFNWAVGRSIFSYLLISSQKIQCVTAWHWESDLKNNFYEIQIQWKKCPGDWLNEVNIKTEPEMIPLHGTLYRFRPNYRFRGLLRIE